MNLFRWLFLWLSLLVVNAIYAQVPAILTKKYPPSLLQQDVKVMKSVIMAMHPAVEVYQSRGKMEHLFDDLIAQLTDSLTEKQFRIRLKLLADELHCSHTEVILSRANLKAFRHLKVNFSPYYFLPVDNKLYVLASLNKKKDTLLKQGMEIRRLNGVSIDTSFALIRKMISSDGNIRSAKDLYLQRGFNAYHLSLFGRPDTMSVEYVKGDSSVGTVSFKAFRAEDIPSFPLQRKEDSLYKRYRRAGMSYRYLDAMNSAMHLRIHRFSALRYKKAYRRIFRKLEKDTVQRLVIDLRNNGGGSLSNSYTLLRYLLNEPATQTLKTGIRRYPYRQYTRGRFSFRMIRAGLAYIGKHKRVNDTDFYMYTIKPKTRHHYNGEVIVLINGGSFSASCLVSAYLKYQGRATFIGQETGGAYEGCNAGATPYYTLPNTKIRLRVPAFRVVHDPIQKLTARGILPDYPVAYQFNDFVNRKDLELAKVKELWHIK